jgi:YD repeat-containing protein
MSCGAALIEGAVSELANVTVNGQAATVRALPGGSPYLFSKELALAPGTHQITVNAQDQAKNTTIRRYNVTVGGTERTLTYDTNGNLTEERVAGGATRTYQWDSLNRLIAIQSDKIPVPGSWRTEFAYDGQSRRVLIGPDLDQTAQEKDDRKWQWFMGGELSFAESGFEIILRHDGRPHPASGRRDLCRARQARSERPLFAKDGLGT